MAHVTDPAFNVVVRAPGSPMDRVLRAVDKAASTDAPVLITGEAGTGRELLARQLHARSARAPGPFVAVHCAGMPDGLLEAELFGVERTVVAGGTTSRPGRLAAADGGTLLLDDVDALPVALQVRLLRVLEERAFDAAGGNERHPVNARIIATSSQDLAQEVEAGRFRRDLYYRLSACPLSVPALRERAMDVAVLFDHFWAQLGEQRPVELSVYEALLRHPWSGNVRELEHLVSRLSLSAEGEVIRVDDLPPALSRPASPAQPVASLPSGQLEDELEALLLRHDLPAQLPTLLAWLENMIIDRALDESHGNKKAAADRLGLQRTTLVEKLRRREKARLQSAHGAALVIPASIDGADRHAS